MLVDALKEVLAIWTTLNSDSISRDEFFLLVDSMHFKIERGLNYEKQVKLEVVQYLLDSNYGSIKTAVFCFADESILMLLTT